MRYFDIETSFARPHVRAEFPTLDDAKAILHNFDVFTETQVGSNPELAEALERWDRGDRSLLAHDHARAALGHVAEEEWTEFFAYVDGFGAMFQEHAAQDHFCDLVSRLVRNAEELQEELKSLGIRDVGVTRWNGPRGEIRVFSTV